MTHALKRFASLSAAVVVLSAFAFVPAAFAASSSQEGYARPGGTSQVAVTQPADPAATASTTKTQGGSFLPFTGLDVGFLVMVGGGLLTLGYGLRRLTRAERQSS